MSKKEEPKIEILSLEDEKKIENTLETRKSNRVLLAVLVLIIGFAFFLPDITKYVNTLINGEHIIEESSLIKIGNIEEYMNVKGIKFTNFMKKTDNTISFTYKPSATIRDVSKYNIYIELYNNANNLIYREKFTKEETLKNGDVVSYYVTLDEKLYDMITYAKAIQIKEFNGDEEIVTCVYTQKENNVELNEEIKYSFIGDALTSYSVNKQLNNSNNEDISTNNLYLNLKSEYANVDNTNVETIVFDNNNLSYVIDLNTIDLKESDYSLLYELGTTKKTIQTIEENKSWSCSK